jgi:hypothetical protein
VESTIKGRRGGAEDWKVWSRPLDGKHSIEVFDLIALKRPNEDLVGCTRKHCRFS